MNERRLRKIFRFTDEDLVANRRGEFSERQKKRLDAEAKAEQRSARESAGILFVVAAAGLAVGLTVGSIAPAGIGRVLVLSLMGILWPSAWGWKAAQIVRAANRLQAPRLLQVSGPVHITRHEDEYTIQIGGYEFDVDGNPSGAVVEGDEYTVYFLEATEEILSVGEPKHRET